MKGYLDKLGEIWPQELLILEEEVNPAAFEATAVLRRLEMAAKYPQVVFRRPLNLKGQVSEFPLVMNVFADRARCALALGMRREDSKLALAIEYGRREAGVRPPGPGPRAGPSSLQSMRDVLYHSHGPLSISVAMHGISWAEARNLGYYERTAK